MKSEPTRPRATQSPTSAAAVRRTHSPMSPISPISSASSMNSVGATRISVPGRRHRISASTPHTRPLPRSTIGWYWSKNCSPSRARRSAVSASRRASACRWSSASKISTRSRPSSLARYIAASASASSSAAVRFVPPPPVATPIENETGTSRPPTSTGPCSPARMRSTAGSAAGASGRSSQSTTNSSPPKRLIVSVSRTLRDRRRATSRSTSSPISWPSESLISL